MKKPSLYIYPLFISLGSVAAVLFTPALPAIQEQFSIDSDTLQSCVSIFVLGYALCQLFYGPLTNRIGRKPALYFAIITGIAGSLLCVLASRLNSFGLFLLARFLTALGTGGGLTLTFTIINDVYSYEESRKVIPFATLAFAVLPGISIFIGGLLVNSLGWESCFYFLALYLAVALGVCMRMPETSHPKELRALPLKKVLQQYLKVGKQSSLWAYAAIWGLCTAAVYLFAATAPLISISRLGASPELFGTYNLLISSGMICGTFATRLAARYFSARKAMTTGLSLLVISTSLLSYYTHSNQLSLNTLFFPMTLFFLGMPSVFTNASALAMKDISDKGSASALVSFINMIFAVITLFVTTLFKKNVELILPEIFAVLTFIIFSLMAITKKESLKKEAKPASSSKQKGIKQRNDKVLQRPHES